MSPYQFLCLQVSLVLASYHAPCYEWDSMEFVYILICLFVCALALLCSWANKAPFCPGHWYGPIKGCDQPERFNDGWDAGVDHLTERDREGERDGMLWGIVCSRPVLWLSGSPANGRQDKINLPLLLSGEKERPGSCRSCLNIIATVQSKDLSIYAYCLSLSSNWRPLVLKAVFGPSVFSHVCCLLSRGARWAQLRCPQWLALWYGYNLDFSQL